MLRCNQAASTDIFGEDTSVSTPFGFLGTGDFTGVLVGSGVAAVFLTNPLDTCGDFTPPTEVFCGVATNWTSGAVLP